MPGDYLLITVVYTDLLLLAVSALGLSRATRVTQCLINIGRVDTFSSALVIACFCGVVVKTSGLRLLF